MLKIEAKAIQAGIKAAEFLLQDGVELAPNLLALGISNEVLDAFKKELGLTNEELFIAFDELAKRVKNTHEILTGIAFAGPHMETMREAAEKYQKIAAMFKDEVPVVTALRGLPE